MTCALMSSTDAIERRNISTGKSEDVQVSLICKSGDVYVWWFVCLMTSTVKNIVMCVSQDTIGICVVMGV